MIIKNKLFKYYLLIILSLISGILYFVSKVDGRTKFFYYKSISLGFSPAPFVFCEPTYLYNQKILFTFVDDSRQMLSKKDLSKLLAKNFVEKVAFYHFMKNSIYLNDEKIKLGLTNFFCKSRHLFTKEVRTIEFSALTNETEVIRKISTECLKSN